VGASPEQSQERSPEPAKVTAATSSRIVIDARTIEAATCLGESGKRKIVWFEASGNFAQSTSWLPRLIVSCSHGESLAHVEVPRSDA
jgi:hypothetical protein